MTQLFQSLFYQNTNFGTYISKTKQVMTSSLCIFVSKTVRHVPDLREVAHICNSLNNAHTCFQMVVSVSIV